MLDTIGLSLNYIQADDVDSVLSEIRNARVTHRTSYISREAMTRWARARLENSYSDALSYIDRNYNPLKGWLSRRLMESLVCRSLWYGLGHAGLALSKPYGAFYMLRYF